MINVITKPVVLYLASKHDSALLKNALIEAGNNGNIRLQKIIGSVSQIVTELSGDKKNDLPNIIISPNRFKKHIPKQYRDIPFFDIDWVLKGKDTDNPLSGIFVFNIGDGWIRVGENGWIGGIPGDFPNPYKDFKDFQKSLERFLSFMAAKDGGNLYPSGHTQKPWSYFAVEQNKNIDKNRDEKTKSWFDKAVDFIKENKNEKPKKDNKGSSFNNSPYLDLIMLLRKAYESYEKDRLWEAIIAGKLPPEKTDIPVEMKHWLQLQVEKKEKVELGKEKPPQPQEDDLGYALLFWIFEQSRKKEAERSSLWWYIMNRWGFIDPIPDSQIGKIVYVGGIIDKNGTSMQIEIAHN